MCSGMNKARMTIRFDRETPNGQDSGHKREVHTRSRLQPDIGKGSVSDDFEQGFFREEVQSPSYQEVGDEDFRVIPLPVELLDNRNPNLNINQNNRFENFRVNGRLASEKRRMEQQYDHERYEDEWSYGRPERPYIESVNSEYPEIDEYSSEHDFIHDSLDGKNRDQSYLSVEQVPSNTRNDYGYYRSKKPNSVWKLAGSITGAIVTGLLFGTVVLSMFNGGDSGKDYTTIESSQGTGISPPENAAVNGGINDQEAASVSVSIPQQTFYMLQYGVFSTAERAEQAKGELTQSGIAAFGDSSAENRVYAGVSPDREQAKLLSSQLKGEGVELYVREIVLPGAQSAVFAGEAAAFDIFFEVSGDLAANLSSLSASLLGQETPGPVDEETMKTITGLHLQWTEAVKLISPGMSLETGASLKIMEQEMSGAITALTEYNKNRSKGHLWEIQAGMMNYIMSQRKLVESF